jgi:hypothetical protein
MCFLKSDLEPMFVTLALRIRNSGLQTQYETLDFLSLAVKADLELYLFLPLSFARVLVSLEQSGIQPFCSTFAILNWAHRLRSRSGTFPFSPFRFEWERPDQELYLLSHLRLALGGAVPRSDLELYLFLALRFARELACGPIWNPTIFTLAFCFRQDTTRANVELCVCSNLCIARGLASLRADLELYRVLPMSLALEHLLDNRCGTLPFLRLVFCMQQIPFMADLKLCR